MPAAWPIKLIVIAEEKPVTNLTELAQSDNIDRRLTKLRQGQDAPIESELLPWQKDVTIIRVPFSAGCLSPFPLSAWQSFFTTQCAHIARASERLSDCRHNPFD